MSPKQNQRLIFIVILATGVALATTLVLYSLEQNLLYFYTPSQIVDGENPDQRAINIGGIVVSGSVRHAENSQTVHFTLTDTVATMQLVYIGLLPDLFREGQGIVATGRVRADGIFVADRVLAKHDENYMPPEIAEALERAGKPLGIPSRDTF